MYSTIEEAWGSTNNIETFTVNNKMDEKIDIKEDIKEYENIDNNITKIKRICKKNKNMKNKNLIQVFLIGFLIIFILQLVNNKFFKNI